jgi:hypothetical protein
MAIVNQVEKRVKLEPWQIVKYQVLTHCYLYKIPVSDAELECLTFLVFEEDQDLTTFCQKAYDRKIFSSTQSVRNCLTKSERKGLIRKTGKNKKRIRIHPDLNITHQGNILLDYKFLCVEAA